MPNNLSSSNSISYLFVTGPNINWNLSTESNKFKTLNSVYNLELLNPYHYGIAYNNAKFISNERVLINGNSHFSTSGLIFKNKTSIDAEKVWEKLGHFLRYLRYSSNQFGLNSESSISTIHYGSSIKLGVLTSAEIKEMYLRSDYLNSLVSWDNVRKAELLSQKKFEIPVHEEILLDAINDRNNQEHRKAILYSAIAIESMLARYYDNFYDKMINKNSSFKKYRYIEQFGVLKDPIYKALTDRTDFKKLLHEIPLYLMGRSLLEADNKLYADIIKLYTTRNKIVHWGAPVLSDKVFEISHSSAIKAVDIAIRAFQWLGIEKYTSLKYSSKFIKLEAKN